MPVLRQLKRSPAVWVGPVFIVLAVLNVSRVTAGYVDSYWLEASATVTGAAVLLAPGCAALAAWEAGRLRRGRVDASAPARSMLAVAFWATLPVLLVAAIGLLAALGTVWSAVLAAPGGPDWRLVGLAISVVAAWTAAGYAAGSVTEPAYAVPGALIVPLLWLVFPEAVTPFWIRHLTGNMQHSCCNVETELAAGAITGPATVAAGVAATAMLVVAARWFRARFLGVVAVVAAVAAVAVGQSFVAKLGPEPVAPRASGLECATTGEILVCMWREHTGQAPRAARVLTAAVERLIHHGLVDPPKVLTEAAPDLNNGVWTFTARAGMSDQQITASLAAGLVPPPPACSKTRPWPGGEAIPPMMVWYARTAGVPADDPALELDRELVAAVDRLRARPVSEQRDWLNANRLALTTCDAEPAPLS